MFYGGNVAEFDESLLICQIVPSKLMKCSINKANKQEFASDGKYATVFLRHTFTLYSISNLIDGTQWTIKTILM